MKKIDFDAATVRGEIISNPAVYGFEKANQELLKAPKPTAFVTIPFDFGYTYPTITEMNKEPGYLGGRGYDGKNWCITAKCKNPQKAVEFLDYCFSPDGTRLITSGVEGINWEYVNKKPMLKKETVDAILEAGEKFHQTGILGSLGGLTHLSGLNKAVLHPDGAPVNLQAESATYTAMLNPVQKDYCKYYGVEYPFQAFQKKYEQGLIKVNLNYKIISMPTEPQEIKRITIKLNDILVKGLPRTILEPKTDEEWLVSFNNLRDELNAAGAQNVVKWAKEQFNTAINKAYGQ